MGMMKNLISELIEKKSLGNKFQAMNVEMKLMLKGVPVRKIDENTPDDDTIIALIHAVAADFNITISSNLSINK